MRSGTILIGANATLDTSPDSMPTLSALSIYPSGRILSLADVMLASGEAIGADSFAKADQQYRCECTLDVSPIRLDSLGETLTLRVTAASIKKPVTIDLDLYLEIDDGSPSGPFVATLRLTKLEFDEPTVTVTRDLPRRIFERL